MEHILKHRKAINQIEALKDHTDLPPQRLELALSAKGGHILPLKQNLSLCGLDHPVDAAKNGGFPRPGGADDHHQLPLGHIKTHILHRAGGTIVFFQAAYTQHLFHLPVPFCLVHQSLSPYSSFSSAR